MFDFSDAKVIARLWEDSLTQPCVIIGNLQNILEIRLEDVQHALINVFDSCSLGVPTELHE